MTLSEIVSIIDQIESNEEFYNSEINKSIILNKNGNLAFSDGGNPFNLRYKDLRFIRREKQTTNNIEDNHSIYDEKVWTNIFDYLNSDKANLINMEELEKPYIYNKNNPNKKILEKLYPNLLYSLNKKELELYNKAKILQMSINEKIKLDFKHNLLVTKTGNVYRVETDNKNKEIKEGDIIFNDIVFCLIGNINTNFKFLKDENSYDEKKSIYKGIGLDNVGNSDFPVFTDEMAQAFMENAADIIKNPNGQYEIVLKNHDAGKYILEKNGELKFVSYNLRKFQSHYYNNDLSFEFFSTAEGYLDAAINQYNNYKKRFPKLNMFGDVTKNNVSYGYIQSSIIKTLLAFSCECYLKALLLKSGKDIEEVKILKHCLVDLFYNLEIDDIQNIFESLERNGYKVIKYKSPNLSYDDPFLENKFMQELAKADEAFVDARYCAEDDKDINYAFLVRFACSLREISKLKYNKKSSFDDGTYFNK